MVQLKAMWSPEGQSIYKGKDAQKVADEIFSISDEPTKEQVVEKARDVSTELHEMFEWNDTIAGEKWRGEQARKILGALRITIVKDESDPLPETMTMRPVRMFFGNPTGGSGFVSTMKIMGNRDMYEQLLERAKQDMLAFKNKYSLLKELGPVFEMIDEFLANADKKEE